MLSWPPATRICKGSEPDIFQRQGETGDAPKKPFTTDDWMMTFGDLIPNQPWQIQRLLRRSVLLAVSPAMSNSPLLKICRIMHDTNACQKKTNSHTDCLVAGSRVFLTRKVSYAKNSWMSGRVGQGEANQTIGRHLWGLHLHRWCELRCRVSPCSQLPRELNSNCQKLLRHFQSLLKPRVIRFCIQVEMCS